MKIPDSTKTNLIMTEFKINLLKIVPSAPPSPKPAAVGFGIASGHRTKSMKGVLTGLALAVATLCLQSVVIARPGGTDILHFFAKTTLTNSGIDLDARGRMDVGINRQGNAYNQRLKITLSNLDPGTAYQVEAYIGDNTEATPIAEFTTNVKGAFNGAFVKKGQGKPNPRLGQFPESLDPMCNIRELVIINTNAQEVLRGAMHQPDKGEYLAKRTMNNTGFLPDAVGDFRIKANSSSTQFRLRASHLAHAAEYRLMINGSVAQTAISDTAGKLEFINLPNGSPDALDIQTVALADSTGENIVLISGGLGIPCTTSSQASISLGAAANYAVLAGSTVANTGLTTVDGDLGVSPGSAVTGFPPGIVTGTQHVADSDSAQAQLDLTIAYNAAAGRTVGAVSLTGNLGGMTLVPGLYKSTSSLEVSSGDLTLDARGDSSAVFIFQMASTLITTAGRQVILSGGAKASNIFWQVGSSATLGTTSVFKGTIMADQSITLTSGATLEGRALARIGAVTADSNSITIPTP
jgi:hypothetical protein